MGWFGSSKPEETQTPVPVSEFSGMAAPSSTTGALSASQSASIKEALMKQIQTESNTANVRMLMEVRCTGNPQVHTAPVSTANRMPCHILERQLNLLREVRPDPRLIPIRQRDGLRPGMH